MLLEGLRAASTSFNLKLLVLEGAGTSHLFVQKELLAGGAPLGGPVGPAPPAAPSFGEVDLLFTAGVVALPRGPFTAGVDRSFAAHPA